MALSLAASSCRTINPLSSSLSLARPFPLPQRAAPVSTFRKALGVRSQFKDSDNEKGTSPLSDLNIPSPAEAAERISKQAKNVGDGLKNAAPEETPLGTSGTLGFTKKNELFVGRMAMLGFAAATLAEAVTGKGVFGQLNLYTGASMTQVNTALLIFITTTLAGALWATGTRGYSEADPGQPLDASNLRESVGLKPTGRVFGFNLQNEYLHGRIAQLGFIGILFGEIATGRGPLGQISVETSAPYGTVAGWFLAFVGGMLLLASTLGDNKRSD